MGRTTEDGNLRINHTRKGSFFYWIRNVFFTQHLLQRCWVIHTSQIKYCATILKSLHRSMLQWVVWCTGRRGAGCW